MRYFLALLACASVCASGRAGALEWRCGAVEVDITPRSPIWLAGYAARTRPSEGVLLPIHAKAVALAWGDGEPFVIVSAELCELPGFFSESLASRLKDRFGLKRSRLLLAVTHTHSSPAVTSRLLPVTYPLQEDQRNRIAQYSRFLCDSFFKAAQKALLNMQPARVTLHRARAYFARNRRHVNPDDPVDTDVPVFKITLRGPPGSRRREVILFSYACHNTTLMNYLVSGDYAGFAQAFIQERYPCCTAVFLSGCAGDINPYPRRSIELCRMHGLALADSVSRALRRPGLEVRGPLRSHLTWAALPFERIPTWKELLEEQRSKNPYTARRARRLLKDIQSGMGPEGAYPVPVQALVFGERDPVLLVALGGEAVVDYALKIKSRFGERRTVVVAYSNAVPGYIPTERILKEGGYEGGGAQLYYCFPSRWKGGVEGLILNAVYRSLRAAGLKASQGRSNRRHARATDRRGL